MPIVSSDHKSHHCHHCHHFLNTRPFSRVHHTILYLLFLPSFEEYGGWWLLCLFSRTAIGHHRPSHAGIASVSVWIGRAHYDGTMTCMCTSAPNMVAGDGRWWILTLADGAALSPISPRMDRRDACALNGRVTVDGDPLAHGAHVSLTARAARSTRRAGCVVTAPPRERAGMLGHRIRAARISAGMTLADVGRACHVPPATVARWERGIAPTRDARRALARALPLLEAVLW
mgnify:CR=1 FL=1